jgi:hypothetical protein
MLDRQYVYERKPYVCRQFNAQGLLTLTRTVLPLLSSVAARPTPLWDKQHPGVPLLPGLARRLDIYGRQGRWGEALAEA